MMMTRHAFFLTFALQLLIGCATGNKTVTKSHEPPCPTRIEATLHSEGAWHGNFPVIVVKTASGDRTLYGEFVSVEENGIRFDPKRLSPFVNDPERLYSYKELICAIDADGEVIYGSPPTALSMDITLTPEIGGKDVVFTLRSKILSSACIAPGLYQVTEIQCWNGYHYHDKCLSLPKVMVAIQPGKTNHIGDLYVDQEVFEDTDTVLDLPFKIVSRPAGGVGVPVLFVNHFGSAAGAGLGVVVNSDDVDSGTHTVIIKPPDIETSEEQGSRIHAPLIVER